MVTLQEIIDIDANSRQGVMAVSFNTQDITQGLQGVDLDLDLLTANTVRTPASQVTATGSFQAEDSGGVQQTVLELAADNAELKNPTATTPPVVAAQNSGDISLEAGGATRLLIGAGGLDFNQEATQSVVWASGTTANRPASPVAGQRYFDTDLGRPIWFDGTGWVDAAGTAV